MKGNESCLQSRTTQFQMQIHMVHKKIFVIQLCDSKFVIMASCLKEINNFKLHLGRSNVIAFQNKKCSRQAFGMCNFFTEWDGYPRICRREEFKQRPELQIKVEIATLGSRIWEEFSLYKANTTKHELY